MRISQVGLDRLTANALVATVLGSIPASSDTVESEGLQMKQCRKKYIHKKIKKIPLLEMYHIVLGNSSRVAALNGRAFKKCKFVQTQENIFRFSSCKECSFSHFGTHANMFNLFQKVDFRFRSRIRIKVKSWIRIRIWIRGSQGALHEAVKVHAISEDGL
jgi:hypothetical protein